VDPIVALGGLLGRWFQPPDAENRTSGGVGGVTGSVPSPLPDQARVTLR